MCESLCGADTGCLSGSTTARAPVNVGQLILTKNEALISIIQVSEACQSSDGKYPFKLASQQVIERVLAYPPKTFHVELKGTNLEPHLNVVLKTSALNAVPLLADIYYEALTVEQESVTVPFNPPCSVWSLVTVLLLLEGDVTIEGWLGSVEHDVSLAARTLEMADFLRVTSLVQGIQEWLRGRVTVARSIGLSRKIWHNSQILVAVPQRFCRAIFLADKDPAETISGCIRLYAPVFFKWLQGAAPSLDLRAANLHLLDWACLFRFLKDVPEVVEVHLRGEVDTSSDTQGTLSCTQNGLVTAETVDSTFTLSEGFLKAIEAAGQKGSFKHIHSLALHGTTLRSDQIPAFQNALSSLHESLHVLTISSVDFVAPRSGQKCFSAGDKWMIFRAIAKVTNLRYLKLPEALWKALMSEGEDVADPLWQLKGLVVQDCYSGLVLAPAGVSSAPQDACLLTSVSDGSSDTLCDVGQGVL